MDKWAGASKGAPAAQVLYKTGQGKASLPGLVSLVQFFWRSFPGLAPPE